MKEINSQEEDTVVVILHPSESHLTNDISPMNYWPGSKSCSPIREKSFLQNILPVLLDRQKNLDQIENNRRRLLRMRKIGHN